VTEQTIQRESSLKKQFENTFKEYFKLLCFHAMSFTGDENVAKDIVHDVFLSLWEHRVKVDFSRPILPYLLNLTRNRSIDYLKHQKVKSEYQKRNVWTANLSDTGEEQREHERLIQEIIRRIDGLPGHCAEVMHLCFVDCKKYKEVAELLGISVNTVKTYVSMGLKILREEFPASILWILIHSLKK